MQPRDVRRIKRRLKASFALGLGLAAGAFLACMRVAKQEVVIEPPPPNPTTAPTSSIVLAQHTRDAAVDRDEHRQGMPVPDNLLE
jgi:hypothetical protein